ncbi:hypothetical protein TanjilG_02129 [Lupinus angustifolius]|uniref:Late embryogenesis abundant protein LEA-2 subgroup domain-containing protein n=1 Tax=Lupinus angustifolius TaxID=3871 RepID=A0A394DAE4_LUPAN|nr:PREDICTED: NDR1/HIN1-Like protein 3-like [Lupinus angustifolius]OIW20149.1 hypothetical protein TanjilG_02129 [Lupinus angustifolius]
MSCRSCCICFTICTLITILPVIFTEIFSPSSVKFHVTDTLLTQFNLTNNNTMYFNFKVNITARNPNKNTIVYYRRITAIAWYKDNDFAYVSLTPFDQGKKNTSLLQTAVFQGSSVIKLKPRQLAEYYTETRVGVYNDLAVDLDMRVRYKYGRIKSTRFNPPIVQCRLRVPLISNGTSLSSFNDTKCSNSYFFVDRDAGDG